MPNGSNDPMSRVSAEVAYTVRDLVLQVSTKIDAMNLDLQQFKTTVVTKDELNTHRAQQRSQRNWSIGIIVTIMLAAPTAVVAVVSLLS
jgi:hypothetical protein